MKYYIDLSDYHIKCELKNELYTLVGLHDGEYFLRIPKNARKTELIALVAEFFDDVITTINDIGYIELFRDNVSIMKYEFNKLT